jgi:hypothetical protein
VTSLAVKAHWPGDGSLSASAGRQPQGSGIRLHVPVNPQGLISKAWSKTPATALARPRAGAAAPVRERAAHRAASGKLICVFDLDHTLVHTLVVKEGQQLAALRCQPAYLSGDMYELTSTESGGLTYFTKRRPGVQELLEYSSSNFEVWLFTNGRPDYAEAVLKSVLDPTGVIFGDRVIAQGSVHGINKPKHLDDFIRLRGMQRLAVLVDDIPDVWTADAANVLCVEPYNFFPNGKFPSYMESGTDEAVGAGIMAIMQSILCDIVASLRAARRSGVAGEWDVRLVMDVLRKRVLAGVHIVFSGNFDTKDATLCWHAATKYGAVCSTRVDDDKTTHVVAHNLGTADVAWARARGVHVVTLCWIKCSTTLWRPADESAFMLT